MAITGDGRMFTDFFPEGLIPELLNLVMRTWRIFRKPNLDDIETHITRRFRECLKCEKNEEDLPFQVWQQMSITDSDTGKEGIIDLMFIPLGSPKEEIYFGFECKRLNVKCSSGIRSGAGEYVGSEGMMRFVDGKYARGLKAGGMIGYVMDGNVTKAVKAVASVINRRREVLYLLQNTGLEPSSFLPKERAAKETTHGLGSGPFVIHHLFLGV